MKKSCLIIGAGIAGLLAATELQKAGLDVTVLDKGRSAGGRMATRQLSADSTACADHGAQYFTVRSDRFHSYVIRWLNAGIIREWAQGFYDSAGKQHVNGVPRYVGVNGMTAVAEHLAQALNVHTGTQVVRLDFDQGFKAEAKSGELFESNLLLMTPPAEQTLALIDSGNLVISAETRRILSNIQFNPCFAVMAQLAEPSYIPAPGGIWPIGGEPISWIADNQQKGISQQPSITIHAGAEFTKQHFNTDHDIVVERLLNASRPYIGKVTIVNYQLQRWRYSIPTALHDKATHLDTTIAPIAFAGDAFHEARVEGAALSGLAAAERLAVISEQ